jgi:quinol monooxygenase YgiN
VAWRKLMAEEGNHSFALMKNGTNARHGSVTLHHELLLEIWELQDGCHC